MDAKRNQGNDAVRTRTVAVPRARGGGRTQREGGPVAAEAGAMSAAGAGAAARRNAIAVAAVWVAGLACTVWINRGSVAWGLPAIAAAACACCLALGCWPRAWPARAAQSLLWIALFCLALVPPLYTVIADTALALNPNRFMCDVGDRMVRCGMIGIEALAVPCVVLAAAVVCRIRWRDAAVERIATAVALAIALVWTALAVAY
ncbi:hypothetical protein SAMN04487939_11735 [Lysobacter sp. yr284]|nr:hypothetical protein SAMN04487939_11735 [Lysobacter sp. yr284]